MSSIGVRVVARGIRARSLATASALKHRPTMPFDGGQVTISRNAFVAPSATVIGDVEIGDTVNILYNAVVRGDLNKVKIGPGVTIGERVTISTVVSLESGFPAETLIHMNSTVGAGSALRSCILMPNVTVGENCVIAEVFFVCCFTSIYSFALFQ